MADPEIVNAFVEMGYSADKSAAALIRSSNDPDMAMTILEEEEEEDHGVASEESDEESAEQENQETHSHHSYHSHQSSHQSSQHSHLSSDHNVSSLSTNASNKHRDAPTHGLRGALDTALLNTLTSQGHVPRFASLALVTHARSLTHTIAHLRSPAAPFYAKDRRSYEPDIFLHADADRLNEIMGEGYDMYEAAQSLKDHGNDKDHAMAQLSAWSAHYEGQNQDAENPTAEEKEVRALAQVQREAGEACDVMRLSDEEGVMEEAMRVDNEWLNMHGGVQDTESQVGQLELMGFEKEAAQRALLLKGEVDAALTFLMEEKKKAPPVDNNVSSPPTPAPLKATTKEFVPTASPTSTSPRMPSTTVPTTEEQLILAGYKGALCQMFMQGGYCQLGVSCMFAHGTVQLNYFRQRRINLAQAIEMEARRNSMLKNAINTAAITKGSVSKFVPGVGMVKSAPSPPSPSHPSTQPAAPENAQPTSSSKVPLSQVLYVGNIPPVAELSALPTLLTQTFYAATGVHNMPVVFRGKARHFVFVNYASQGDAEKVLGTWFRNPERFALVGADGTRSLLTLRSRAESKEKEQQTASFQQQQSRPDSAMLATQAGLAILNVSEQDDGKAVLGEADKARLKRDKKKKAKAHPSNRNPSRPGLDAGAQLSPQVQEPSVPTGFVEFKNDFSAGAGDFPSLGGKSLSKAAKMPVPRAVRRKGRENVVPSSRAPSQAPFQASPPPPPAVKTARTSAPRSPVAETLYVSHVPAGFDVNVLSKILLQATGGVPSAPIHCGTIGKKFLFVDFPVEGCVDAILCFYEENPDKFQVQGGTLRVSRKLKKSAGRSATAKSSPAPSPAPSPSARSPPAAPAPPPATARAKARAPARATHPATASSLSKAAALDSSSPLILIPGPGFVFHCNKDTRGEVLSKMLFGSPSDQQYRELRSGHACFLYNYSTQTFEGLFVALSSCSKDIDASAWKGKYPHQVKFEFWSTARIAVKRSVVATAIGNPKLMKLSEEKQQALTVLLQREYGMKLRLRVAL